VCFRCDTFGNALRLWFAFLIRVLNSSSSCAIYLGLPEHLLWFFSGLVRRCHRSVLSVLSRLIQDIRGSSGVLAVCSRDVQKRDWPGHVCGMQHAFLVSWGQH